jgi:hypothetical protein
MRDNILAICGHNGTICAVASPAAIQPMANGCLTVQCGDCKLAFRSSQQVWPRPPQRYGTHRGARRCRNHSSCYSLHGEGDSSPNCCVLALIPAHHRGDITQGQVGNIARRLITPECALGHATDSETTLKAGPPSFKRLWPCSENKQLACPTSFVEAAFYLLFADLLPMGQPLSRTHPCDWPHFHCSLE